MFNIFRGWQVVHALPLAAAENDWSDFLAIVVLIVGVPVVLIGSFC